MIFSIIHVTDSNTDSKINFMEKFPLLYLKFNLCGSLQDDEV